MIQITIKLVTLIDTIETIFDIDFEVYDTAVKHDYLSIMKLFSLWISIINI